MRSDSLAEKVMSRKMTDFWKEVNGLNKCTIVPTDVLQMVTQALLPSCGDSTAAPYLIVLKIRFLVIDNVECVDCKGYFFHLS